MKFYQLLRLISLLAAFCVIGGIVATVIYERKIHSPPEATGPADTDEGSLSLKLAADKSAYFQHWPDVFEPVILRIIAQGPESLLAPEHGSCPITLALKERFPGGNSQSSGINSGMTCRMVSRRRMEITYEAGVFALQKPEQGEYTLSVSALGKDSAVLAASNRVTVRNAGEAAMKRAWGAGSNGYSVSLALDGDEYAPGDDIHLHLACRRDKDWTLSGDWRTRLCDISLELRDADGEVIERNCPPPSFHGSNGPATYRAAKDEIVPVEKMLAKECLLPDKPGSYTLTATGHLHSDDEKEKMTKAHSLPVTFRVKGE